MKNIELIFTLDFDQWLQEMIRKSLVLDVKKIWGISLSDQITYFDGQSFIWYRYKKDMNRIKTHLISLPLNHKIFSKRRHKESLKQVQILRALTLADFNKLGNPKSHLKQITTIFAKMYPFYPLGIFIAGPWRDDFLKYHGKKGNLALRLLFHSRKKSEGLLKIVGNYLRAWTGFILKQKHYAPELSRLLSVSEVKKAVFNDQLPKPAILKTRNKGYVYFKSKIIPVKNFQKFLKDKNLNSPAPKINNGEIKGNVAFMGKTIVGKAQLIYNSFQIENFKKGSVLITPMTSPDYLPAMKTAKAIITDEGGLTCHAAITARELKKPCIIGTKIATKVFKDGDMVEVDTSKGTVKKI